MDTIPIIFRPMPANAERHDPGNPGNIKAGNDSFDEVFDRLLPDRPGPEPDSQAERQTADLVAETDGREGGLATGSESAGLVQAEDPPVGQTPQINPEPATFPAPATRMTEIRNIASETTAPAVANVVVKSGVTDWQTRAGEASTGDGEFHPAAALVATSTVSTGLLLSDNGKGDATSHPLTPDATRAPVSSRKSPPVSGTVFPRSPVFDASASVISTQPNQAPASSPGDTRRDAGSFVLTSASRPAEPRIRPTDSKSRTLPPARVPFARNLSGRSATVDDGTTRSAFSVRMAVNPAEHNQVISNPSETTQVFARHGTDSPVLASSTRHESPAVSIWHDPGNGRGANLATGIPSDVAPAFAEGRPRSWLPAESGRASMSGEAADEKGGDPALGPSRLQVQIAARSGVMVKAGNHAASQSVNGSDHTRHEMRWDTRILRHPDAAPDTGSGIAPRAKPPSQSSMPAPGGRPSPSGTSLRSLSVSPGRFALSAHQPQHSGQTDTGHSDPVPEAARTSARHGPADVSTATPRKDIPVPRSVSAGSQVNLADMAITGPYSSGLNPRTPMYPRPNLQSPTGNSLKPASTPVQLMVDPVMSSVAHPGGRPAGTASTDILHDAKPLLPAAPRASAGPPMPAWYHDGQTSPPAAQHDTCKATPDTDPPAPPLPPRPAPATTRLPSGSTTFPASEPLGIGESRSDVPMAGLGTGHPAPGSDISRLPAVQVPGNISASNPDLTARMAETLIRNAGRPVEIALSPEELGRVRMALNPSEIGITVTISADRPETQDLIRRHAEQLAADLRGLGYESVTFSFSGNGGQTPDRQPPGDRGGTGPSATVEAPDPAPLGQSATAADGLDLRM